MGGLACALLFAGVFLLYAGAYRYPLVFDDVRLLGTADLPRLAQYCLSLSNRCVSYTTFGLTYLAVGLDLFWFHFGNVMCHALAVLACFIFLDRVFEAVRRQSPGATGTAPDRLVAFCGAALFAVHPVTVYGVAYLSQRSTVMATLFSLLSLAVFVRALMDGGRRWLWLSALLYGMALLSKEHAVMLPAVALAIAVLLGKKPDASRPQLAGVAATIAVAGALVTWRLMEQGFIGAVPEYYVRELEALRHSSGAVFDPWTAYLGSFVTQTGLFFNYLLLWLIPWPGWMSVDLRPAVADGPLAWPYVLGVPAFAGWGAAATVLLRRRGAAGLLGLAMLFPWLLFFTEFTTARLQEPFVLYRSYLWMAGLPLALPLLARRLSARQFAAGCAVLALILCVAMRERLATFSSDLALWDDAVSKSAGAPRFFSDRAYVNRAFTLMRANRLDEALNDIEAALGINPRNTHAYLNRGTIYSRRGENRKALEDFDHAISLDPGFAEAHGERCAVLILLEEPVRAQESCEAALQIAPRLSKARLNRAVLNARAGRMPEALRDLDIVLKEEPANAIALYDRGMVFRELGRMEESVRELRASCNAGLAAACDELR